MERLRPSIFFVNNQNSRKGISLHQRMPWRCVVVGFVGECYGGVLWWVASALARTILPQRRLPQPTTFCFF